MTVWLTIVVGDPDAPDVHATWRVAGTDVRLAVATDDPELLELIEQAAARAGVTLEAP